MSRGVRSDVGTRERTVRATLRPFRFSDIPSDVPTSSVPLFTPDLGTGLRGVIVTRDGPYFKTSRFPFRLCLPTPIFFGIRSTQ